VDHALEAFIIDAIRTPTGRRNGSLANVDPIDLAAFILKALVERNKVPAEDYDDNILGVLDPIGAQADDIARTAWLAAGLPHNVPGVTVDRQCGSGLQAITFAAQAVMSGTMDVVVAGGTQSMSRVPLASAEAAGVPLGFPSALAGSKGWEARYGKQEVSQFRGAETMAERAVLSREDMEAYALRSNERALAAAEAGRFAREIVPFNGLSQDETPRQTTMEKMATLKPVMGTRSITAAVSSQIADGASALLIASEAAVRRYDLTPRARIHHMSVWADDPIVVLSAPIPATQRALKKTGLSIADLDLAEVNEAFAPVPMVWQRTIGYPEDRLNVNGGAIALGHPVGASGARLTTTLLHELERTRKRFGLVTLCEGGGQANVAIIERL
jgi:acetyl-CoA C-acetyltransferase